MIRWLILILGIAGLWFGTQLLAVGQPEEGDYRYSRAARAEAKRFSRTIQNQKEKDRFLTETTGRVKIEHQRELFLGGTLCAVGVGFTFGASMSMIRQSRTRRKKARAEARKRDAA